MAGKDQAEMHMAESGIRRRPMNPLRPLLRQLAATPSGSDRPRAPQRSDDLRPRTRDADRVVKSVCPYCAVGCGQKVYVKDERVIQIEGDPDSPISRGRLCPKGSASERLVNSPVREYRVKYRRPHGTRMGGRSTSTPRWT